LPDAPSPAAGDGGRARKLRDGLRQAVIASVLGEKPEGLLGKVGRALSNIPALRVRSFHGNVIDELIPRKHTIRRALDVGCGDGKHMLKLQQVGWETEGVEWDSAAAEIAHKRTKRAVWRGDFRQLNLPLGAYGLVYLSHVFEHLDDPVAALTRIRDLLAPTGLVALIYPNPESLGAKLFGGAWYPWEAPRHLILPPSSSLIRAANRVGLTLVKSSTSAAGARAYFAHSRSYRKNQTINESCPSVTVADFALEAVERMLLFLNPGIGEDSTIILRKNG
jgi:SAM-dependent methyltransferase